MRLKKISNSPLKVFFNLPIRSMLVYVLIIQLNLV